MSIRIQSNDQENPGSRRWAMVLAGVVWIGLAVGCASPRDPASVENAREALEVGREMGLEGSESLDFREAERHMAEAERLLRDEDDQELIDHEADLAATYAAVAVARKESVAAREAADAYINRARTDTATTRLAVELAIQNAQAIDARQSERGLVLTLGGVLFGFDSAEMTQEAKLSVARVAGFLIALENRDAMIEGHTDGTGSADYNLGLSLRRAESIRDALIAGGVGEERLLAAGYGSRFPVADNETDEGRARNRRVEIVILKPGLKASDAGR
ncbi:MAG: OmpA family protein [Deltaproteobacteria bacterium]|jgi:outer membrane protein OmpA-like peptidoglycan-associated protein|nr:OmpA family protein [Deltaproteobacteria bacterium]MBW2500909.1 OmpA family protein [Deltaproteobacteria bacterium]